MHQPSTFSQLATLLAIAVAVTIGYSYIPADFTLIRQVLSLAQLVVMIVIAAVTVRSVLSEF